jgi:hypothetical protein
MEFTANSGLWLSWWIPLNRVVLVGLGYKSSNFANPDDLK